MEKKYKYTLIIEVELYISCEGWQYIKENGKIIYDLNHKSFMEVIHTVESLWSRDIFNKVKSKLFYEVINQYQKQGRELNWR